MEQARLVLPGIHHVVRMAALRTLEPLDFRNIAIARHDAEPARHVLVDVEPRGRKLEAKYQWQQSLTLKPDKDLIATIDKKLKDGLAEAPATKAANSTVQKIAE